MTGPQAGLDVALNTSLPGTWCVVQCRSCEEAWVVDVTDFDPPLSLQGVIDLVTPALDEHECPS